MIWFFDRNGERLRYEIRRTPGNVAYELSVTYPDGRIETQETGDPAELLERCAELARTLVERGWRAP